MCEKGKPATISLEIKQINSEISCTPAGVALLPLKKSISCNQRATVFKNILKASRKPSITGSAAFHCTLIMQCHDIMTSIAQSKKLEFTPGPRSSLLFNLDQNDPDSVILFFAIQDQINLAVK